SRRRHTRWPRDWSSDVCSSDLAATTSPYAVNWNTSSGGYPDGQWDLRVVTTDAAGNTFTSPITTVTVDNTAPTVTVNQKAGQARSEERRVGKEWRGRWVTGVWR